MKLHPHNVVALNTSRNKCSICGNPCTVYYFPNNKIVCEWCQMEKDPAIIKILYTDSGVLYFEDRGRYLYYASPQTLGRCGWFLRKVRKFDKLKNDIFRGEYTFEFHGHLVCGLVKGYALWPTGADSCFNCPRTVCESAATNNFWM